MANRTPRQRMPKGALLVDRLFFHTRRVPGGCWVWNAAIQVASQTGGGGYGLIQIDKRLHLVHRVMYELLVEPIPEGMQLDHLCRNRACVNPAPRCAR